MTDSRRQRPRILIIDDDVELVGMLCEYLDREGFDAEACHDGDQALSTLRTNSFDLAILDVMLPGQTGLELLRHIAPQHPGLGVIMLTARGDAVDRILGLELGADDYLPKPFDPRELAARLRAILRRRETSTSELQTPEPITHSAKLILGSLQLDTSRKIASANGQSLVLTAAEFRVLQRLLESPGVPVDRESLTVHALGRHLTLYDRSIDTHISNLRRKLEKAGIHDVMIQSVRGAGYEILERQE